MELNELTERVIGAAIEVHRELGAGLLESAYRRCLCRQLTLQWIPYSTEMVLPVTYKGLRIDSGYRLDLLVDNSVEF